MEVSPLFKEDMGFWAILVFPIIILASFFVFPVVVYFCAWCFAFQESVKPLSYVKERVKKVVAFEPKNECLILLYEAACFVGIVCLYLMYGMFLIALAHIVLAVTSIIPFFTLVCTPIYWAIIMHAQFFKSRRVRMSNHLLQAIHSKRVRDILHLLEKQAVSRLLGKNEKHRRYY